MTRHRDWQYQDLLPSSYMDALGEFISTYASPNFVLQQSSPTTVLVAAGGSNGQVCVGINGSMRFISAPVSVTCSGTAGARTVYLAAPVLDKSQEDTGTFNYAFTLSLTQPTTGVYRAVGGLRWDGSKITFLFTDLSGAGAPGAPDVPLAPPDVPVGVAVEYAGIADPSDPRWMLEDGRKLLIADYQQLYAALGPSYNIGGETGTEFRIPDSRGRVTVTADNMGTAAGAAGRMNGTPGGGGIARGGSGGREGIALNARETAIRNHKHLIDDMLEFTTHWQKGRNDAGLLLHNHGVDVVESAVVGGTLKLPSADAGGANTWVYSTIDASVVAASGNRWGYPRIADAALDGVVDTAGHHDHPVTQNDVNTNHYHFIPQHGHNGQGVKDGLADQAALDEHINMPPYVVKNKIIRVR